MSYNARVRAKQNRAGGLYGLDRGWVVGSDQSGAIGIPARLVNTVKKKTTPINIVDGVTRDDRNLVVVQDQLQRGGGSWLGGAFGPSARGIEPQRYYLGESVCTEDPPGSGGIIICPVGSSSSLSPPGDVVGYIKNSPLFSPPSIGNSSPNVIGGYPIQFLVLIRDWPSAPEPIGTLTIRAEDSLGAGPFDTDASYNITITTKKGSYIYDTSMVEIAAPPNVLVGSPESPLSGIISDIIANKTPFRVNIDHHPIDGWTKMTSLDPSRYVDSITSADYGRLAVVNTPGSAPMGNKPTIYYSIDNGITWSQPTTPPKSTSLINPGVIRSAPKTDNVVYAPSTLAGGSNPFYSSDAGKSWVESTGAVVNWDDIALSRDGKYIIAVADGVQSNPILISDNSGVTFTPSPSQPPPTPGPLARQQANVCACAKTGGVGDPKLMVLWQEDYDIGRVKIYQSTNLGVAWAEITTQPASPSHLYFGATFSMSGNGDVLLATGQLTLDVVGPYPLYLSIDAGGSWVTTNVPDYYSMCALSHDGTILMAAAEAASSTASDKIYISTDTGVTWTTHTIVNNPDESQGFVRAISVTPDGSRAYAGISHSTPHAPHSTRSSGLIYKQLS